jgi:hypothetical protein
MRLILGSRWRHPAEKGRRICISIFQTPNANYLGRDALTQANQWLAL